MKWPREDDNPLSRDDATAYRALVASANYLAQDRSDRGFAVKELCRRLANPCQSVWERLKRLGRHLLDKTRVVSSFAYQTMPESLTITVDTDHAGCLETSKSTSRGVAMIGSHCIRTWSVNQQVIAL